jgi:hypothetical protein
MSASRPVCNLTILAWVNVGLHLAGLGLAAVGLRPGTPLVPLAERLAYLAGSPPIWAIAWAVWMLCAVALVLFLIATAQRIGDSNGLVRLAVVAAVVGVAFDFWCDAVYIVVFPRLAADPPQQALFLAVEQIMGIASLVIANGAYSLAALLLTLGLRGRQGLAPFTIVVGYGVFAFGMLLAAAGFTGVPWHTEWATGPTIGLYCIWAVLVARSLEPGSAS